MPKARIMVVEDEYIIADDIVHSLKQAGYATLPLVTSGDEAVRQALKERPDLILMDIVLRGEKDGIQAAREIRAQADIPVIFLTAYADPGVLERAKSAAPFGYLLKPFDERELYASIETALYRAEMDRKLAESEIRYRRLVENINDIVFSLDAEGRITFISPSVERYRGFRAQEIVGRAFSEFFHPDELPRALGRWKKVAIGEDLPSSEYRFLGQEGEIYWMRIYGKSVFRKGRFAGLVGVAVDITAQKEVEQRLARELEVQAALADLSRVLLSPATVEEISHLVFDRAKALTNSPYGFVGHIHPKTGYLEVLSLTRDVWDECQVPEKSTVFKKFRGLWGWVLEHKAPLLANDPDRDPRSGGTPPGHIPIRRFLSVPAVVGENVVGQISVANAERDYGEADRFVLERLADVFALAVERRRAEEALQEARDELERRVAERTAELSAANARLKEEIRKRTRAQESMEKRIAEIDAFNRLSRRMNASLSLQDVVEGVLEEVERFADSDVTAVFLLEENGSLIPQGIRTSDPAFAHIVDDAHHAGECLCGKACEGVAVYSMDIHRDERCTRPECRKAGLRSFAALPLVKEERVVGVLGLASLGERDFSRQSRVLEAMAGQVAVGLENARLHHELTQYVEDLEAEVKRRREAEETLRSERDKFRGMLSALGDEVYIVNREYRVEYQNAVSLEEVGDVRGTFCYRRIGNRPAPCTTCRLQEALRTRHVQREEYPAGNSRLYENTWSPFTDVDGKVKAILIRRDMTEKRRLQAETLRAGHLASLGELAAGVAHEINNPVNSIINYAQILADDLGGAETGTAEIPDRIVKEGRRVAKIVQNLLSFARQREEEHSPARIQDILADSLGLLERQMEKEGIRLEVDLPEDLPRIQARSQEIQQVFVNLVSNARYALNRKYPGPHPDKVLRIRCQMVSGQGRDFVRTTFSDHGTGIPPALLDRICDPFFSTKPKGEGTGLGLSISHGIVKAHKGSLRFESKEGEYTRVVVDLPVSPPGNEQRPDPP